MDTDKPQQTPVADPKPSNPIPGVLRKIGVAVLVVGLAILAYGAVGFWFINALPPNGGATGRLPSLYVMAVGMIVTLVGLAVRGFPFSRQDATGKASRKGIPTSYGLLLILAIIIFAIFAISRM